MLLGKNTEVAGVGGLVYVGKIAKIEPIEGADRIELAMADCGSGGGLLDG